MNASLSSYLNLLRFLAALAVYLFHGQHFAGVRIPYVGNFGSEAVIVFFVLSGLVIAFSGIKQPDGLTFLRARLTRLWSVCLPALALTFAADTLGQYLSLASYAPMQPYNWFKWTASIAINALFLNQVWNANIYAGTNGPFWSLSYEFWYYMIFGAALYFGGKKKFYAIALTMLIAGPAILIGLPVWLMGCAVYFAIKRRHTVSDMQGWMLWLGSLLAAVAFFGLDVGAMLRTAFPHMAANAKWNVDFWPESYLIGAIVAVNIYGFSMIGRYFDAGLAKCASLIRLGADISFGLYLFHYPLMYLSKAILNTVGLADGMLFATCEYTAPFVLCAVLALVCEKHKDAVGAPVDRGIAWVRARVSGRFARPAPIRLDDPLLRTPSLQSVDGNEEVRR